LRVPRHPPDECHSDRIQSADIPGAFLGWGTDICRDDGQSVSKWNPAAAGLYRRRNDRSWTVRVVFQSEPSSFLHAEVVFRNTARVAETHSVRYQLCRESRHAYRDCSRPEYTSAAVPQHPSGSRYSHHQLPDRERAESLLSAVAEHQPGGG